MARGHPVPRAAFVLSASRRRHTRLQGDWSSDVCSSDLLRSDAGQGTVEYVGLLLLVGALIASIVVGITKGHWNLAQLVVDKLKAAINQVAGAKSGGGGPSGGGPRERAPARPPPRLPTRPPRPPPPPPRPPAPSPPAAA